MNVDSGHLVRQEKLQSDSFAKHFPVKEYEPVPKKLQRAAELKLAGRDEAHVSLTSGGKLSKWAAGRRRVKRKMQKDSRRRNRAR